MSPTPKQRRSVLAEFYGSEAPLSGAEPAPAAVSIAGEESQRSERIIRLKPSQMLPDRYQPRRILPASLREGFFSGKITCYQAAAQWLVLAREDDGYRLETERLLAMGDSFTQHGQIKPITGMWAESPEGKKVYLIETGERRFWAACLQNVAENRKGEPLLRVEVIEHPTRQRQVIENRHAELPSAVSQACEIAALILAELGINPSQDTHDEYDYFRQARAQRMPAGLWDKLTPLMQLTRPRMVQLLNILQLPTPLLELADRYRLPERVLREIVAMPRPKWEQTLKSSIQNQLTAEEVAELARDKAPASKGGKPGAELAPHNIALGSLRRFAGAMMQMDAVSQSQALDEIADSLVVSGIAEGLMEMLGELSELVEARLSRRGRDKV
jgi:hypothetical protein